MTLHGDSDNCRSKGFNNNNWGDPETIQLIQKPRPGIFETEFKVLGIHDTLETALQPAPLTEGPAVNVEGISIWY